MSLLKNGADFREGRKEVNDGAIMALERLRWQATGWRQCEQCQKEAQRHYPAILRCHQRWHCMQCKQIQCKLWQGSAPVPAFAYVYKAVIHTAVLYTACTAIVCVNNSSAIPYTALLSFTSFSALPGFYPIFTSKEELQMIGYCSYCFYFIFFIFCKTFFSWLSWQVARE